MNSVLLGWYSPYGKNHTNEGKLHNATTHYVRTIVAILYWLFRYRRLVYQIIAIYFSPLQLMWFWIEVSKFFWPHFLQKNLAHCIKCIVLICYCTWYVTLAVLLSPSKNNENFKIPVCLLLLLLLPILCNVMAFFKCVLWNQ